MEDKRREIKKSYPADFKKICGTEETLDSIVKVANTFNQVLNIYCGVPKKRQCLFRQTKATHSTRASDRLRQGRKTDTPNTSKNIKQGASN